MSLKILIEIRRQDLVWNTDSFCRESLMRGNYEVSPFSYLPIDNFLYEFLNEIYVYANFHSVKFFFH
jgi:hypothetical protein